MIARLSRVMLMLCLAVAISPATIAADDGRSKIGPAGGDGGDFSDKALPKSAQVIGVKIRYGVYIDGVELLFKASDGKKEGLG